MQLSSFRKDCNRNHDHCCSFDFVWKNRCFDACFVLHVIGFHVIICVAVLYMNQPECADCAVTASFLRECYDVSYIARELQELILHKETVVLEEMKEVEIL